MQTVIYVAAGTALTLGALGGASTPLTPWYRNLKKPGWKPPDWAFGPAWSLNLAGAATASVLAWNAAATGAEHASIIIAFAVNGLFFLLWSPLFFIAKRPDWALIEWVFLWASVAVAAAVVASLSPLGGLLMLPYLAWVSVAGLLNRAIVRMNRPFGTATEVARA